MGFTEYKRATGINAFFVMAIGLISPVLAPHIKNMGFDNIQLGLLFSLMPFIILAHSPILGRISDNIGRNIIIRLGIIMEILAIFFYALGNSWYLIALARILDALAAAGVGVILLAKIQDSLNSRTRGKYAGISLSVKYAGRFIGPLLGGFLADKFFVKFPFIISAAILCLLLFFLPKERKTKKITRKDFNWFKLIKRFLSHKELRGMAILGISMHANMPAIGVFLPLLIVENMGLSYSFVGIAIFFLEVTHLIQFWFGKWADKKAYKIVLTGTLVSGCFLALLSQAYTYFLLLAILFLMGMGNSMWNVSAWTLMSNIAEKKNIEGEVIGSYIAIAQKGAFISFLASGFIVNAFGIRALFFILGCTAIIGTACAYPLLKK